MPALGRSGDAPPFGTDVISATYTEETELIDITNRTNAAGGYKTSEAGFTTKTWEIECHDATGLVSSLTADGAGFQVMSITENINVDGPITFTVTAKEM